MGQVAVYSEVERRRRWSDDERLQMLGEAFSPGAVVTGLRGSFFSCVR